MKKLILLVVFLAGAWLLFRSCGGPTEISSPPPPAVTKSEAPKAGATLNSVFPKGTGDFKLTFTQEKEGFAQAEWSKGSAKLATIAITDTNTNPSARDKFREASKKLAGYPVAAVGSQGTAVLVADRFQVQVRSTSPAFSAADRDALVEKCNLQALAGK